MGYGEKSKEDGGKEMGRRGIERMGMHGGGGRGRDEEGERECREEVGEGGMRRERGKAWSRWERKG